jgi:serine protease Do
VLLVATLGLGVGLGLALGGAGVALWAQVPVGGTVRTAANVPPAARPASEVAVAAAMEGQYARFAEIDRTFALASRSVAPAVVHIIARKPGRRDDARAGHPQFVEETGSGVIVRPDAGRGLYILTNHHVVAGSAPRDVAVLLHDGRSIEPERIWVDRKADIAVLKLAQDDLPTARLGDSDRVEVGTWVLALGSPFGLTQSVSQGIISARNRHEEELEDDGVENQEFLQTDAAINPGNSGGPLVNLRGEVIGINTAIASNGGGSEGVGFSIPINLARWIMEQLVTRGRVSRGALGVNLQDLSASQAQRYGLACPRGAYVLFVREGTPAAGAGLREGDVILRFNGLDVVDINHLINLVSRATIGQEAEVVLWRDGAQRLARVAIADQDAILASSPPVPQRITPADEPARTAAPAPSPAPAPAPPAGARP